MRYENMRQSALDYQMFSLPESRLQFRGPKPDFGSDYVVFLGGAETFGRFLTDPYPSLVQSATGATCVNLGVPHAGPDLYLSDAAVMAHIQGADHVFVQLPSVSTISNRFYKVHPRRNDRFVAATVLLRSIYRHADFTEFTFVRHMLTSLYKTSPERFDVIITELQMTWSDRMSALLKSIKTRKTLVWFARHGLDNANTTDFGQDPLFVTRPMVDDLSWYASDICEIPYVASANGYRDRGLVFDPVDEPMTRLLMGQAAHLTAADRLIDLIERT